MSTQKRKFELFAGLARLGFTYDESAALRRIEMTLQRWGEAECGDGNEYGSWAIERDEASGKPFRVHHHYLHGRGKDYVTRHAIADREAGALRRLAAIVAARNDRNTAGRTEAESSPQTVFAYHQGDCRGCNLYLLTRQQIGADDISSIYTRGLAVCA
jgi:hypothetical protein